MDARVGNDSTVAVGRWWEHRNAVRAASVLSVLACTAVLLYQLTRRGALLGLSEYDDGVYLGSAIRLVHGAVPYRDFAFPHPPGMPLLLSPLALVFRWSSERTLMGAARIITACIAVCNVWLLGRLLRHRGAVAVLAGSLALAVFPLAPLATKSVLIEPYLVLFCLLGCTLLFNGDAMSGGRRLFWASVLFGVAATVKVWAAFPVLALLLCCVPHWRSMWRRVLGGLALGFVVPSLPFFVAAPRDFVRQIVLVQAQRAPAFGSLSVGERLPFITGLRTYSQLSGGVPLAALLLVMLLVLVASSMLLRRPSSLDVFLLASSAITVVAMLVSGDMFMHYAYFSAALLALLGACAIGSLLPPADAPTAVSSGARRSRALVHATVSVAVLTFGAVALVRTLDVIGPQGGLITVGDPGPQASASIPEGACVLFDEAAQAINANRFVGPDGCPPVTDTYYEWIVRDPGNPPPTAPPYDEGLVRAWRGWLDRADYVLLSADRFRVPWTPELVQWFDESFDPISQWYATVYRRSQEP